MKTKYQQRLDSLAEHALCKLLSEEVLPIRFGAMSVNLIMGKLTNITGLLTGCCGLRFFKSFIGKKLILKKSII